MIPLNDKYHSPKNLPFTFWGDLNQLSQQGAFLRKHGFNILNVDIYPAVASKEEYIAAIKLFWDHKVEGWHLYKKELLDEGYCTEASFNENLEFSVQSKYEAYERKRAERVIKYLPKNYEKIILEIIYFRNLDISDYNFLKNSDFFKRLLKLSHINENFSLQVIEHDKDLSKKIIDIDRIPRFRFKFIMGDDTIRTLDDKGELAIKYDSICFSCKKQIQPLLSYLIRHLFPNFSF